MTRLPYENFSKHRDANPCVEDIPKSTILVKIRETLKTITLFVLSIVVFIFAVLVSAMSASLLGIFYAGKETIEHLKGLFQKEKRLSSLWHLVGIGVSAYVGWILGAIIGAAIFSSGAGLILGSCIVLGWMVGFAALTVKYIPLLKDHLFPKKSGDERDTSRLDADRADSSGDLYEHNFLLNRQFSSESSPKKESFSEPTKFNSSNGFFGQFCVKETVRQNQNTQLSDCSPSSESISYRTEQSRFER